MFHFIAINNATATTAAAIEFSVEVTHKHKVTVTVPIGDICGGYTVNGETATKEEAIAAIAKVTRSTEWNVSSSTHFAAESMGERAAFYESSQYENDQLQLAVDDSINAFVSEVVFA